MNQKEINTKTAQEVLSGPFWAEPVFPKYYAEEFAMESPCSPPGLPNYFDTWESERCFEWLNRTVLTWDVQQEGFFPTPDENMFWAMGIVQGRVVWGVDEGFFRSRYFIRLEFTEGKISFLKAWVDSLAFLRAANLPIPPIKSDFFDPRIDEFIRNTPPRYKLKGPDRGADPYEGVDMSEDVVRQRMLDNLGQNNCGVEREKFRRLENFHPEYQRGAYFLPVSNPYLKVSDYEKSVRNNRREKKNPEDTMPEEIKPRSFANTKVSSPWMYRDTRGKNYPTDDPHVWFAEMLSNGPCCWLGNHFERGHYHQKYLMYLVFDDAGRELVRDEIINPQYKYSSCNIPLPSFPYYA